MKPVAGRFHGGLVLDRRKSLSNERPVGVADIPPRLVFPLRQRSGENARPLAGPGDRVLRGERIAGGDHELDPPIHASTSGRVLAIEDHPIPHPAGTTAPCMLIEPDGLDEAAPHWTGLDEGSCPPAAVLKRLHEAGIVGLGGAGFPTAAKLAHDSSRIDTLIINGAECEPYISCDELLLRERARDVLRGTEILRRLLGAPTTLIAIESDLSLAVLATERALADGHHAHLQVAPVPVRYPAGGERQLIECLTGREVPSGGLPADIGVLCVNVATAAAIFHAVAHGAPLTSRIVTVTGRGVRQPRNLDVRLGTPVASLIQQCGGYSEDAARLLVGGPMMGYPVGTDAIPVTKAVNAILVAGSGELPEPTPTQPCIRCGACAEVCPARLLPQELHWHARSGQLRRALEQDLFDCIECGCCDAVCPSQIPLVRQFQAAKQEAMELRREREQAERARSRHEARLARLAMEQKERERAARARKAALGQDAAPGIREALERARLKRARPTLTDTANAPDEPR